MGAEILTELASRYRLPGEQISRLAELARMSVSLEISGTAIHDYDSALDRHIADSVAGLEIPEIRDATRLADIGSGIGLPGLAIAIVRPELIVTLIDSVRKKADVAARIARELGLTNVESVWGRVEEVSACGGDYRKSFGVVTARALADLNVLFEYAAPLLRRGGSFVAWKGTPLAEEREAAARASSELGFDSVKYVPYRPFPKSGTRHFVVACRTGELSERFPRRAGAAVRKPLGGLAQ